MDYLNGNYRQTVLALPSSGTKRLGIYDQIVPRIFAENAEEVGKWGVETKYPRIYRSGSAAARGGAVSGIPGYNAAQCVLSAHRSNVR